MNYSSDVPVMDWYIALKERGYVMKSVNTKTITLTGVLLAICIIFQFFKGISPLISGPVVNAIIIIATAAVGLWSGTAIALLSPIVAYILGATPILQIIPLMIPVIMAGNWIMVGATALYKKNDDVLRGVATLIVGAVCKAAFLWIMVAFVMLPIFGKNIPTPQQIAMKTMFSTVQLITALIGILIALLVWKRIGQFIEQN